MSKQQQAIVTADDSLICLVVDDNQLNLTMALSFLREHNLKADVSHSGAEALRMIEEKASSGTTYDLVFMDHMMPEMDGVETTKRIREWERKTGQNKQMPIIALSANTAAGAENMFISAGMNDFISKPIAAMELNRVLGQWLPAGKIRFEEARSKATDPLTERLLKELSGIKGLDANACIENFGPEAYLLALRQFSENCDSYLDELNGAVKAEAWDGYSIKAHALKGVLAAFGHERLSQWAANLETASKSSESLSLAICRDETSPFCTALAKFRDLLRQTSLFNSSDIEKKEKPKGDKNFLREYIGNLRKACTGCSSEETEKILAALFEYEWDSGTDAELEKIRVFASSYQYEEALEIIGQISLS